MTRPRGLLALVIASFAAVFVAGAACIDLEGAYQGCVGDHRCAPVDAGDGGVDAGGSDSGTPADAGDEMDSGTDAGADAGPPYDGGAPCTGSENPRLRCAAPITLTNAGSQIRNGAIAAAGPNLLAAWNANGTIRVVKITGEDYSELDALTTEPGASFGFATQGEHWALVYLAQLDALECETDTSGGPVPISIPASPSLRAPTVALSPTGEVAISVSEESSIFRYYWGEAEGCPSVLTMRDNTVAQESAVTWVQPIDEDDRGFRYVTSKAGPSNGEVRMERFLPDGGVDGLGFTVSGTEAYSLSVGTSSSGDTVLIGYDTDDGSGSGGSSLGFKSIARDFSAASPARPLRADPGYWWVTACGPGCAALVSGGDVGEPWSVSFFSDDEQSTPGGTWDVACGAPQSGSAAGTFFDGKLQVLVTSANTVQLYRCDLPPL